MRKTVSKYDELRCVEHDNTYLWLAANLIQGKSLEYAIPRHINAVLKKICCPLLRRPKQLNQPKCRQATKGMTRICIIYKIF